MSETLAPGNLPLLMRRGSTFGPISIFCKNGLGAAFDLTGYSAHWFARPEIESPNVYDLGPEIVAGATGEILTSLTDEETLRDWPAGKYQHGLVLETSGGVRGAPSVAGVLTVVDESARAI